MLRVAVRPSAWLTGLFALGYGTAATCLLVLPLALWLKAGLAAAVAAAGIHAVLLHALCARPGSVVAVELGEDCTVRVVEASGAVIEARLLPSTFVTPWLTVLDLAPPGRRRRGVLLTADRVDAEAFRRLRTALRWRCRDALRDAA